MNLKTNILKLAKSLNKFSLADVLTIIEIENNQVNEILSELEEESFIKKIKPDQYVYVKKYNNNRQTFEQKNTASLKKYKKRVNIVSDNLKKLEPIELFNKEEELKIYEESSPAVKKYINKYVSLFKITIGLAGRDLDLFLKDLALKNSEFKIKYNTFKRHQKEYIQFGIRGLIPKHHNKIEFLKIHPELYAFFKKLYLHPQKLTLKKCIEIIKKEEQFKCFQIPYPACFKNFLYKEFSLEEITQIRNRQVYLPELKKTGSFR